MNKMKCLLLAAVSPSLLMAQTVVKPGVKTATSFAIVIDQASYDRARQAVDAYKASIEADGLGTYVLIDRWQSPEPIREQLQKLHADKKSPLEGCVLVGDIPIPKIRDGQYLTSAFKMNQERDWKESSIASDRYYDDFGLKFDFLKQDADLPLYFYYSLRPDSRHHLRPDIYSGRIKPLELEGVDKYELLRKYLNKVVREKRENAGNVLDRLTMARGHSYNSEDRAAWAGEQLALKEQMPQLFLPGGTVKFIDFDTQFPAKNIYLNEVQVPDLDVMLFHHHGATDTQYLNGYKNVSNPSACIESVKVYLRSKLPARAKKVGREQAVEEYMKNFDVPRSWCEEAFDEAKLRQDSLDNELLDIHVYDIHRLTPNARFVLFDACYNGSFYENDNIAGAYIFNDGNTIAAVGGTVNTIQDKWPDEFLGLLAAGMRVGQFNRLTGYLESHLIGDPTFRFAPNTQAGFDINQALTLRRGNISFWRSKLNHPLPDVQALALRQLSDAGYAPMAELLQQSYFGSSLFVVRMEAVRLLALRYPLASIPVLKAALNDSYELVRRLSCEYVENNASPELIPTVVDAILSRGHENRLGFHLQTCVGAFDAAQLKAEFNRQRSAHVLFSDTIVNKFNRYMALVDKRMDEDRAEIADDSIKIGRRKNAILGYRNHPQPQFIDTLFGILTDTKANRELRIAAAQTLGWYDCCYLRADIATRLRSLSAGDAQIDAEIQRSVNRLSE